MVNRDQHLGVETTSTYWAGRMVTHIRTIKDSPLVALVAGYVASVSMESGDIEHLEDADPMEKLDLVLDAEQRAFDQYMQILNDWPAGDTEFRKAGRLAGMLVEANHLALGSVEEPDDELTFAVECAKEYAKVVKTSISMFEKTSEWADEHQPMDDSQDDIAEDE